MPSKKKKYNARFPPARIKKIMQTDEDVGKVAAAVPVIISRALELFIETLITESKKTTQAKHAKTLSTGHIKQTILAEKQFDFLKDLVANIPDVQPAEDEEENTSSSIESASCEPLPPSKPPKNPSQRPRGRPRKNEDDGGKPRRKKRKVIPVAPQCDDSTESDEEGTNYTESKSGYQESSLNTAGTSKASATVVRSSTETLASSSSPPPRASSCSPQPLIIPCSADDAVPVCSPVHPQRALTPSEPFRRYAEHPVADHSPETHPPPTGHLQVEPSSENHQVEQAPIKRHHIDHLQSSQSDPVPESLSFPHVSHKHSSNNVMVSLHSADNGPRRAMSGAICMVPHHLPPSCSASGADFLPSHSTFSRSLPSGYPYDRPSGLAPQPEQTEVLDLSTPNRASDKLMTSEDTPRVPAMTTTFSPLSQNKDPQYRTAVENMGSLYPRLPPYGYPSLHTLAPALSHLSGMAAHPYSSVPQSMQLPHEPSPGPRMFSQPPVAMPASLSHTPDDDYDS